MKMLSSLHEALISQEEYTFGKEEHWIREPEKIQLKADYFFYMSVNT